MEIVILYARRGFPFTGKQLCTLAYEMATRDKKRGFSPVKMTAGRCWLRGFYKRHPEVRSKVSVNLSIARAISANPTQISHFFDQYKEWVDNWGLEYLPNNIWNVDECGVGDVPQPSTVVGVTGECSFQTVSGEKPTNTTVVSYISAGGMTMPPLVIFKAARIKPEWHEAAPTGYMIQGSVDTSMLNSFRNMVSNLYALSPRRRYSLGTGKCCYCLTCTSLISSTLGLWNL